MCRCMCDDVLAFALINVTSRSRCIHLCTALICSPIILLHNSSCLSVYVPFIISCLILYSTGYRPIRAETAAGDVITDWSKKPPDTLYIVGEKEAKKS